MMSSVWLARRLRRLKIRIPESFIGGCRIFENDLLGLGLKLKQIFLIKRCFCILEQKGRKRIL